MFLGYLRLSSDFPFSAGVLSPELCRKGAEIIVGEPVVQFSETLTTKTGDDGASIEVHS